MQKFEGYSVMGTSVAVTTETGSSNIESIELQLFLQGQNLSI